MARSSSGTGNNLKWLSDLALKLLKGAPKVVMFNLGADAMATAIVMGTYIALIPQFQKLTFPDRDLAIFILGICLFIVTPVRAVHVCLVFIMKLLRTESRRSGRR